MTSTEPLRQALWKATAAFAAGISPTAAADWAAARSAYHAALAGQPTLWTDTAPVLLAPVRLETRYLPAVAAGGPARLAIRVVPDTIGVFRFESDLTADELAAARDYRSAAAADAATAWTTILNRLGAARAAWAVEVSSFNPTVSGLVPRTGTHPATSLLLPDKFTFRGWREGQLIFEQDGLPVTADLQLGPDFSAVGQRTADPAPTDPRPTNANPAAVLPPEMAWTDKSKWMVDLEAARLAGMAVIVDLPGTNLVLDSLTVVGVSGSSAADGANQFARTLQGHLYTDGLGYPAIGAPTNNTEATRTEWTTRPTLRTPDEVAAAVAGVTPGSGQPAVALADAFGLARDTRSAAPGRRDLLAAPGATERDDDRLPALAAQLLTAYYSFTNVDPTKPTGWLTSDGRRAHFIAAVRADGPLPVLRLGQQPYAVLPVTSLLAWAPAPSPDVPDDIVTEILQRQAHLDAMSGFSPRLNPDIDEDQDPVLVELLERQPTAVALWSSGTSGWPSGFDVSPAGAADSALPLAAMDAAWRDLALTAALFGGDAQAAQAARQALTTGLDLSWTAGGLYWALQANAARSWQQAWNSLAKDTWTPGNTNIEEQLKPLRTLEQDPAGRVAVDRQLCAGVETLTNRLDAWATSVATARLQALRRSAPTGLHVGMYGWLVEVEPLAPEQRASDDGWAMTPSVQHAVTASVLFAGAQAHSSTAFDIDLSSARVRRARTVLAELRNGSTLEELLGYQLERALHDNHFDTAIATLRSTYPLPAAPTGEKLSDAERAARLVVDGDQVRNHPDDAVKLIVQVLAKNASTPLSASVQPTVQRIVDDLRDTVDAVGDVLMAESVHHLVGGSPLRAGLTADTLGKAAPPPEQLEAVTTPTSGVSVTHCLGLAVSTVPVDQGPWMWGARARLDPVAETICQWALGAPTDWRVTVGGAATRTLADAHLSALDVVAELSVAVNTSALAARLRDRAPAGAEVVLTRADGMGDPDTLPTLCAAVRTVLSRCRAVPSPSAALAPGAETGQVSGILSDLQTRVTTWWTAVQQLFTGPAGPNILAQLSEAGLSDAHPGAAASTTDPLRQRWAGLPAVATAPTPALITPAPEAPGSVEAAAWLDAVARGVGKAAGDWFTAAVPDKGLVDGWTALTGSVPTAGGDDAAIEQWLGAHATLCPGAGALADLLALSGACGAGHPPAWLLRQQLGEPTATTSWVGTAHPGSRSAVALTTLQVGPDRPDAARALLLVDQWSEVVPAAPRTSTDTAGHKVTEPQQQAALALRFDSPDSRPPQSLLLVTPPDPQRGWRADDLYTAVEETLWWATTRALDAADDPGQEARY